MALPVILAHAEAERNSIRGGGGVVVAAGAVVVDMHKVDRIGGIRRTQPPERSRAIPRKVVLFLNSLRTT